MSRGPRIDNDVLLNAGLRLMEENGKPLKKIQSSGRSMQYQLPNGETVRVRTCNDHLLIVLADSPDEDAPLNIEGTNWLLIVMPEVERTPGKVNAFLVPTAVAVQAARSTHKEWLSSNPNTKGGNVTWNLWFDDDGPTKSNAFARKWGQYRLKGSGEAAHLINGRKDYSEPVNVKAEVEVARQRISKAAGVPPEAVRITVDFSG
jgi:hypothetical protein